MAYRIPTRSAGVAAALLLTLAACGGGDSGGDSADGGGDSGDDSGDTAGLEELLDELGVDDGSLDLDDLGDIDLGALEDLDLDNLGDLGALGELFDADGLEELIEESTDGEVDVEFGDDGISVETEDGSFSIDEDGDFTVTDEDGQTTTGDVDIGGGDLSIEGDDGDVQFNTGSEFPEDWPDEVPRPEGIEVATSMSLSESGGTSIVVTGTVDGDVAEWAAAFGGELEDAGFSEESSFEAAGAVTASYVDDAWNIGVIAAEANVSVSVTPV